MSKGKVIVGLVLVLAIWLVMRPSPEVEDAPAPDATAGEPAPDATAEERAPAAGGDAVRRRELEMAVEVAAGSAECGYSEVGYGRVEPGDAAGRLVERMRSASAPAPGDPPAPPGAVEYVEGPPERAWQVAVRLAPDSSALLVEGYGSDLEEPLVSRRVPCS